jgi:head-tail adaptor
MQTPTIGELRHHMILERPTASPDGAGGAHLTWSPVANAWALIEEVKGKGARARRGGLEYARHRITVRNSPAVEPADRLRLGTRFFYVLDVEPLGSPPTHLACICDELTF